MDPSLCSGVKNAIKPWVWLVPSPQGVSGLTWFKDFWQRVLQTHGTQPTQQEAGHSHTFWLIPIYFCQMGWNHQLGKLDDLHRDTTILSRESPLVDGWNQSTFRSSDMNVAMLFLVTFSTRHPSYMFEIRRANRILNFLDKTGPLNFVKGYIIS